MDDREDQVPSLWQGARALCVRVESVHADGRSLARTWDLRGNME